MKMEYGFTVTPNVCLFQWVCSGQDCCEGDEEGENKRLLQKSHHQGDLAVLFFSLSIVLCMTEF